MTPDDAFDGFGMDGEVAAARSADERGPTTLSTALVLAASLGAAAALAASVGPTVTVLVAAVDAALFGASLWLVGRDRWRGVAVGAAGVLALFVGAGFTLAVGYTGLTLASSLFPVDDFGAIPASGLRMASATLAVAGATLAMIGGVSAVGNVLRSDTVARYAALSVKTFVVPGLIAVVTLVTAILPELGATEGLGATITAHVELARTVAFTPPRDRTHLLPFFLLVAVTAEALSRAVRALPFAELATSRTGIDPGEAAEAASAWLQRIGVVAALAIVPSLAEFALSQPEIRSALGAPVYGIVVAVTASHALRALLATTLLVSLAIAGGVWSVRRAVRSSSEDVLVTLTPFVGGLVVAGLAVALHDPVLDAALALIADRLPGEFGTAFDRTSEQVVEFFGPTAIAMTVAAMLVWLTALLSGLLAAVAALGFLPERATAAALAGAGLFAAAAFAAAAGASAPLALGGLVASLVVWDAGEYGVALGREIGRAETTRGTELVHLTATVAVGGVGALAAAALHAAATDWTVGDLSVVPFALAGVLVGLILLLAALR